MDDWIEQAARDAGMVRNTRWDGIRNWTELSGDEAALARFAAAVLERAAQECGQYATDEHAIDNWLIYGHETTAVEVHEQTCADLAAAIRALKPGSTRGQDGASRSDGLRTPSPVPTISTNDRTN